MRHLLQREVIIREFVQVSAIWKSIPEEVTRLLKFSGNIGYNSDYIKKYLYWKKEAYEQKPCGKKEHGVCKELKEGLNVWEAEWGDML